MSTFFLVFRKPGPSWVRGVPTRQQPLWDEHAAFIDPIFEQGHIVMAGPYADWSRALIIVKAENAEEAVAMFRGDPWERAGILVLDEVVEWNVFLDSRAQSRKDDRK
ncbi:MAG: hypothetical protein C5B50_03120 [Verrucomicrobia bacterium]|nr:MAG: hypothetical protein C5B50_03120 [Verrucomicrobiota bacterium]